MKDINSRNRPGKQASKQADLLSTADRCRMPSRLGEQSKRQGTKRTVSRKLTRLPEVRGERPSLESQSSAQTLQTDKGQDLMMLVLKYFEDEIRETMMEVMESFSRSSRGQI